MQAIFMGAPLLCGACGYFMAAHLTGDILKPAAVSCSNEQCGEFNKQYRMPTITLEPMTAELPVIP